MITVAAIISLRNLPIAAEFGLASITFYALAAVTFFIPIALVTAELATALPKAGGCYIWVSEAFGKDYGFFTLWAAWMESIAWFPAILSFIGAMLGYILSSYIPGLEKNNLFILVVMLIVFWGATFSNFFGIKFSGFFSSLGVILGTLIPGMLIIGLGVWWLIQGNPSPIIWEWKALIPDFKMDNIVFFSGILLGLAGIELAAFHIREAKAPQQDYPKALAMAACIIIGVSILGTLSIAIVVPSHEMSLVTGLLQAFEKFLSAFHLEWAVSCIALFALIGSLAGVNTWTVGPAKGLLVTVEDGYLPPALQTINRHHVPTALLILQACIGTVLSLVFLYLEDTSAAFWILTGLAAQFTFIQYIMVFAAALILRKKAPNLERPFKVPGGCVGMAIVAITGILVCVFCFFLVFIPPSQLETGDSTIYKTMLLASLIVLLLPPIILAKYRNRAWQKKIDESLLD